VRLDQLKWSSSNSHDRAILDDEFHFMTIYRFRIPGGYEYTIMAVEGQFWFHLDDLVAQCVIYHLLNERDAV
jgi:hypothetical protein